MSPEISEDAIRPVDLTDAINRFRPFILKVIGEHRIPDGCVLDRDDLISIACMTVATVFETQGEAERWTNSYVCVAIRHDIYKALQWATREKRRPPEPVLSLSDIQYETDWLIRGQDRVAPSAEEVVIRREELGLVVKGLLGLPEGERRCLLKRVFEGKTHSQIASETGIEHSRVGNRLDGARKRLRAALDPATEPCSCGCGQFPYPGSSFVRNHDRRKYRDSDLLEHGTLEGYRGYRCRCELCRAANTEYYREYRARKKARA